MADTQASCTDVAFGNFPEPEQISKKREICKICKRPAVVCICSSFPNDPLPIQTRLLILQHPHEENRSLATVPLLQRCIPADKCTIIQGKRFGFDKSEPLNKALQSCNTVILYPGTEACDIVILPRRPIGVYDDAAVIAIDGTWSQSKGMYSKNSRLHHIRQVQVNLSSASEYVIRTQPTKTSLSTLECIAHTLGWLENNDSLVELKTDFSKDSNIFGKPVALCSVLLKPLRALCQHQLDHGAIKHHSKDDPDYIPRQEMKKMSEDSTRKEPT